MPSPGAPSLAPSLRTTPQLEPDRPVSGSVFTHKAAAVKAGDFGMLVRPHAVGADGMRVRYGSEVDVPIGWDDVRSITRRKNVIGENNPR